MYCNTKLFKLDLKNIYTILFNSMCIILPRRRPLYRTVYPKRVYFLAEDILYNENFYKKFQYTFLKLYYLYVRCSTFLVSKFVINQFNDV